jgi:hypothetical protein
MNSAVQRRKPLSRVVAFRTSAEAIRVERGSNTEAG